MILIDMEMPTYCYDCPCHNGENGRCNITGDSVFDKRPFDCPLKEQEVKRGKWEQQTEPLGWQDVDCAVCSVCGDSVILTDSDMDIDNIRNWWNYCPNCGAKMDGKESGL